MVARVVDGEWMNEEEIIVAEPVGRMGKPEEIGGGRGLAAVRSIIRSSPGIR